MASTRNAGAIVRGYGKYKSYGKKIKNGFQAPMIRNSKTADGCIIIRHKEYLGDVTASQAFSNNVFALNPGIKSGTEGGFSQWLPLIAAHFEQWKPRGIAFTFKSTSASSVFSEGANTALGTVAMGTDYNALNAAFASKAQLENYQGSISGKPSVNLTHYVECARRETPIDHLYVRSSVVPSGADARLYDLGTFQLAVSGAQVDGGTIGELWVSYEIELLKPKLEIGGVDDDISFDHFRVYPGAGTSISVSRPFGTSTTVPIYPTTRSTLGGVCTGGVVPADNFVPQRPPSGTNFAGGIVQLDNSNLPTGELGPSVADTYFFPPGVAAGCYMLQYNASWSVQGVAPDYQIASFRNCEALNIMANNGQAIFDNTGGDSTTGNFTIFVQITGANASISFGGISSPGPTTLVFVDFYVVQIPSVIN